MCRSSGLCSRWGSKRCFSCAARNHSSAGCPPWQRHPRRVRVLDRPPHRREGAAPTASARRPQQGHLPVTLSPSGVGAPPRRDRALDRSPHRREGAAPTKTCYRGGLLLPRGSGGQPPQALKKFLSLSVQPSSVGVCLAPPFLSESSNSLSSFLWCSVSLTGVSTAMWQYRSPG